MTIHDSRSGCWRGTTVETTPGVCGGEARIVGTRIPVWQLVEARNLRARRNRGGSAGCDDGGGGEDDQSAGHELFRSTRSSRGESHLHPPPKARSG